ncbi:MAG: hypothetical protein AAF586_02315 [Planctomycetota bacterium]
MPRLGAGLVVFTWLAALGCTAPPVDHDLYARETVEKVPGIVNADDDRRLSDAEMGELVRSLDHSDPAVRFFAHRTLQDATGQDFGYVYYRDARERRAAADRWRAWYNGDSPAEPAAPATQPAVSAAP